MQIKKILLPVLGLAMLLGGCSKQNTNNITISNDSSVIAIKITALRDPKDKKYVEDTRKAIFKQYQISNW